MWITAQQPPAAPVTFTSVTMELSVVLGYVKYISIGCCVLAVITFGALLILDKERGQPISATAPHVTALKIALGVIVISGASALATFFL